MNAARHHAEIREQLALLAAGALDPAQEDRALAHIRSCPQCAAEFETWQALSGALRRIPAAQPSHELFTRTHALAAAALSEHAESKRHQRSLLMLAAFSWIFALIPFLLARMAGIGLGNLVHLHFGWVFYAALGGGWLAGGAVAVLLFLKDPGEGSLA